MSDFSYEQNQNVHAKNRTPRKRRKRRTIFFGCRFSNVKKLMNDSFLFRTEISEKLHDAEISKKLLYLRILHYIWICL